jgi:hypothetical protein
MISESEVSGAQRVVSVIGLDVPSVAPGADLENTSLSEGEGAVVIRDGKRYMAFSPSSVCSLPGAVGWLLRG